MAVRARLTDDDLEFFAFAVAPCNAKALQSANVEERMITTRTGFPGHRRVALSARWSPCDSAHGTATAKPCKRPASTALGTGTVRIQRRG